MSTTTRYATSASGTSWTTPTNANADDGSYATYTIAAKNTTGNENTLSSFGFDGDIPSGATINSVQLEVEHKVSTTGGIANLECAVAISSTTGTWNTDSAEPTTDTQRTYSGQTRPGGGSWTRDDLLDGTFTVRLRARSGNNATSVTYSWDYARVTVDYTAGTNTDLVMTDGGATHANTTDAAGTLTQAYELTVGDGAHAHAADSPTLSIPLYYLTRSTPFGWVQETLNTLNHATPSGWLQESVEAAPAGDTDLVVPDSAHAHADETPTLVLDNLLLTVADAAHAHAAETFDLTSVTGIAPADAAHAHAAETPTLVLDNLLLTVADATHAHSGEHITLIIEGQTNLIVQDAAHAHAAETFALTSASDLVVADAVHAMTVDGIDLTSVTHLAPADATHAHSADNVTVSTAADTPLTVADASHAHAADGITIKLDQLQMQYGFHAVTSPTLDLVAAGVLAKYVRGGERSSGYEPRRPPGVGRERPDRLTRRRS